MVYVHKHANNHVYMYTHLRNAVPLVWGALRLAPISEIYECNYFAHC